MKRKTVNTTSADEAPESSASASDKSSGVSSTPDGSRSPKFSKPTGRPGVKVTTSKPSGVGETVSKTSKATPETTSGSASDPVTPAADSQLATYMTFARRVAIWPTWAVTGALVGTFSTASTGSALVGFAVGFVLGLLTVASYKLQVRWAPILGGLTSAMAVCLLWGVLGLLVGWSLGGGVENLALGVSVTLMTALVAVLLVGPFIAFYRFLKRAYRTWRTEKTPASDGQPKANKRFTPKSTDSSSKGSPKGSFKGSPGKTSGKSPGKSSSRSSKKKSR